MNPLLDALTEAGRQAGLTARHAISGVGGMASAFANPLALALNEGLGLAGSDYRFPDQYAALQRAMTEAGLPEPQGALERGIGFASEIGVPDPTDSAKVVSSLSHMIDPQWAMTVFHGSPHKWDRVDLTKVGTGEGAQAYGHGFYAAESPDVAKEYQRLLGGEITVRGQPLQSGNRIVGTTGDKEIDEWLIAERGDIDAAISKAEEYLAGHVDAANPEQYRAYYQPIVDGLKKLKEENAVQRTDIGHLYELDLPDETIEKMLDWDKPLSEQPEAVKEAFRAAAEANPSDMVANKAYAGAIGATDTLAAMTGNDFYKMVATQAYKSGNAPMRGGTMDVQSAASEYLNSIGIPGIKYLDGTSRSASQAPYWNLVRESDGVTVQQVMDGGRSVPDGFRLEGPFDERTRNFVVFDEQYIKPLTRNGEAIK